MTAPPGPWLAARAARTPWAPALRLADGVVDYGELARGAQAAPAGLRAHGVSSGDTVALAVGPGAAFARWMHGIDWCGATLLPLHLRLAPDELAFQLADSGARCLVLAAPEGAGAKKAAERCGLPCLDALEPLGHTACAPAARSDAPLALVYTAGTSGTPKGVELGAEAFRAGAAASALHLGVAPDDCWLACLPLYHVGGLSILWRSCLQGTAVLPHARFDPEALSRAVDREAVSLVSLVPAMLARWLEERGERRAPPRLRAVLVGGAAAPEALLERAHSLGIPALATYGLTEAASQVATRARGDARRPLGAHLRPLPGTELRVVRSDGHAAEPGEPGEILVRGGTLMRAYRGRREESGAALRGGWLHTGDLGERDAEGGLRVHGRRDDLIVSGGENVYPAEIESVLAAHPEVREAAVVGSPDERFGARPVAYVVPRGEAFDPADLERFCREHLAGFKVPAVFRRSDGLPRSAMGKLLRRRLGSSDGPAAL